MTKRTVVLTGRKNKNEFFKTHGDLNDEMFRVKLNEKFGSLLFKINKFI